MRPRDGTRGVGPVPGPRLVMVMGVQRSGTNALFHSLAATPGCASFNESRESPLFLDYFLRPEAEVRPVLDALAGPVLLKPISETKRRSADDVLREFVRYEVRVLHVYRDPVNTWASTVRKWPEWPDAGAWARQWSARNLSVLRAAAGRPASIAVVRYEDLAADARVFEAAARFVGLPGKYLFREDRGDGRGVPAGGRRTVRRETRGVLRRLDRARRFLPARRAAGPVAAPS